MFKPYTRTADHLDKEDRIWVAGHQAGGKAYCGDKWLKAKPTS